MQKQFITPVNALCIDKRQRGSYGSPEGTYVFFVLSRSLELLSRSHELVIRGNEILVRGNEILIRGNELAISR